MTHAVSPEFLGLHLTPAWLCRPSSWLLPASVVRLAAEICNWTVTGSSNLCPICPGLYRLDWLFAILPPNMQHRLHPCVSSSDASATSESVSTTGTSANNTAIAAHSRTVQPKQEQMSNWLPKRTVSPGSATMIVQGTHTALRAELAMLARTTTHEVPGKFRTKLFVFKHVWRA